MATQPPATNHKAKSQKKGSLVPPEEQFWQRYSPHHEFPLSTASSLMLHGIILALLVLGGIILAKLGFQDKPVEVSAITIAGGGGRPNGVDGPATGVEEKKEAVQPNTPSESVTKTEPPPEALKEVEPSVTPLVKPKDSATRPIESSATLGKDLNAVSASARQKLELALGNASRGKGGSGEGGGMGKGKGTGTGDLEGPGVQQITQRKKRQQRWVMIFNTRDGEDYARQLKGLKALVAIPAGVEGDYLFVDDLGKRPAELKRRDLSQIDRIYWIDDKPDSVSSLAFALRLDPPPRYIVAFFPEELEKELLQKELNYKHAPEDQIEETRFIVRRGRNGQYEPVVDGQTRKRR
jgi:hypothetical protein